MVENFDVLNSLKQSFSNENTILKPNTCSLDRKNSILQHHGGDMVVTVLLSTPLLYSRTHIPTALEPETF